MDEGANAVPLHLEAPITVRTQRIQGAQRRQHRLKPHRHRRAYRAWCAPTRCHTDILPANSLNKSVEPDSSLFATTSATVVQTIDHGPPAVARRCRTPPASASTGARANHHARGLAGRLRDQLQPAISAVAANTTSNAVRPTVDGSAPHR